MVGEPTGISKDDEPIPMAQAVEAQEQSELPIEKISGMHLPDSEQWLSMTTAEQKAEVDRRINEFKKSAQDVIDECFKGEKFTAKDFANASNILLRKERKDSFDIDSNDSRIVRVFQSRCPSEIIDAAIGAVSNLSYIDKWVRDKADAEANVAKAEKERKLKESFGKI